jgi:hypothetical protein
MVEHPIQKVYDKEPAYTRYWRASIAWSYILVCLFDFVIGPIFYVWYAVHTGDKTFGEWQPLTLGQGGLYHLSMGAILGVSSWSRGQEKIKQMEAVTTNKDS